ncbi:MAG: hypothetical protein K8H84_08430 [Sulfuricella denitrificans]|nr:hypothetical protein [Sulfuricella denitrificans]
MRRKQGIKFFLILFALGAIYWFGLRTDPAVLVLNQAIRDKGSQSLRNYPYAFRVMNLKDGVAVMATPRSSDVPVYRMIGAIYPSLAGRAPNDPDFVAAQKELAIVQAEARQIVLDQAGVSGVKWELDQNWLIAHGVSLN